MKKLSIGTRLITTCLIFSLFIYSCKKETSDPGLPPEQEEEVAELSMQAENENELVFNDVFDNVMGVNNEVGMAGLGVFGRTAYGGREFEMDSVCFTVSVSHLSTTSFFPVQIVIDFGGGCLGKDGHTRYGKITTIYTGRLTMPGNSGTTTFDGFKIDSFSVEGKHTITNTTTAGSNQRQFTIKIDNAKITKPSGNYSVRTSNRIITQVNGNATPHLPLDDVFSITGSAYGQIKKHNNLYSWKSEITLPLIKKFSCRWLSKGEVKLWRERLSTSSPWVATLNFGDGTCDFIAILTINGLPRTIKLPH